MHGHFRLTPTVRNCRSCSFIEPHSFGNIIPFDNTTPIYLINLLWKLGLDLELHYFSIFLGE